MCVNVSSHVFVCSSQRLEDKVTFASMGEDLLSK